MCIYLRLQNILNITATSIQSSVNNADNKNYFELIYYFIFDRNEHDDDDDDHDDGDDDNDNDPDDNGDNNDNEDNHNNMDK